MRHVAGQSVFIHILTLIEQLTAFLYSPFTVETPALWLVGVRFFFGIISQ
jgi:hypothetical protein